MITVPKRSFSVLPGFTPKDRRNPDEKGILREESGEKGRWDVSSNLQRVVFGRIVGDERRVGERVDWGRNEISLGGMQVAAAGVDAERPGGESGGFPGGESERMVEKVRDG